MVFNARRFNGLGRKLSILLKLRQRHFWKNMGSSVLEPPAVVRGMLELKREAFQKDVQVPRLVVREEQVQSIMPLLKKLLLKMENLRPVRAVDAESTVDGKVLKEILLHPLPVKDFASLPTEELELLQVDKSNFSFGTLKLNYTNWRADEVLKAVLAQEEEGLTSYSRIGHIVHLNLRDHLIPYKKVIGEVLLDKVVGCRTVVNKASQIDNTYRNFQLELLCGEAEYQVETKENGVAFEFDFSRVYWNPRLSTEHERIVKLLQRGDVLYDVFAGVGPFSVPAAKKRCFVLANDLNPDSYFWLQHNVKRHKCGVQIQLFNKDGRDFILNELRSDLLNRWRQECTADAPNYRIHITMNLPAMAVEFLDAFRGLFEHEAAELNLSKTTLNYPTVHVYTFAKGADTKALALALVEKHLGLPLKDNLEGVHFVRNVSPNKDMYRISFTLNKDILTTPIGDAIVGEDDKDTEPLVTRKRVADEFPMEETQNSKLKCS